MSIPREHRAVLEKKRQELERELQEYATEHDLLPDGGGTMLELCLYTLPEDKVFQSDNARRSFHLNEKDWEDILAINWPEMEGKIINWLYEHDNGPLPKSQFVSVCGEESGRNLTEQINILLKGAANYVIRGRSGRYFKLKTVASGNAYALWKFGYFD